MQNRKLTPCKQCNAYYAIPPNQFCEHCTNGCKHQHLEQKIKTDFNPVRGQRNDSTKVVVEVSNKEIRDAMDLIGDTISGANIGDHVAMVALTYILIKYEKRLGTKIEVT